MTNIFTSPKNVYNFYNTTSPQIFITKFYNPKFYSPKFRRITVTQVTLVLVNKLVVCKRTFLDFVNLDKYY